MFSRFATLWHGPSRLKSRLQKGREVLERSLFAVQNRGDAVTCLLCGWQGKRFRNERCVRCNSLPRHRLVPYAFEAFGVVPTGRVLLHLGPNREETRGVARRFVPRLYLRLDQLPHIGVNVRADARLLPFSTASVDCVLAWHVLEHIPDDRAVIAELRRVLAPGGVAVVSVPIFPPGRQATYDDPKIPRTRLREVFGHEDHVRACGLDYCQRFAEAGFAVRELRVADLAKDGKAEEVARYGLSSSHVAWCFS